MLKCSRSLLRRTVRNINSLYCPDGCGGSCVGDCFAAHTIRRPELRMSTSVVLREQEVREVMKRELLKVREVVGRELLEAFCCALAQCSTSKSNS